MEIDDDEQLLASLGKCMVSIFKSSYSLVTLPRDRSDTDQIEEMLQRPLYVLFRFMLNETSLISLVHAIHQVIKLLNF